jgi:hypothetical protein
VGDGEVNVRRERMYKGNEKKETRKKRKENFRRGRKRRKMSYPLCPNS